LGAITQATYTAFGCTLTNLSITASANTTDNEKFSVFTTASANSTSYTNTAATCTITSGTNSCSFTGTVVIPANVRFGVEQQTPTATPSGWSFGGGLICK
jgi:hypothetical protein